MRQFASLTVLMLAAGLAPCSAATPTDANPPAADEPSCPRQVVRAHYDDPALLAGLARWIEPREVRREAGFALLEVDAGGLERLREAGFDVVVEEELTRQLCTPAKRLPEQLVGIPGYPCYRTVEETLGRAAQLSAEYPNLVSVVDVGDSWEKITPGGSAGYDMLVLKLTNSAVLGTPEGDKPKLFITSAIHAREYATAELSLRFAEHLLAEYGRSADATWLLDEHEIHLMLHTNPDGRKKAESGLSWRKNTNENYCGPTSSSRGADLNRNFEFAWGCCGGSSGDPCRETYRGPTAASEPEVTAVQAYARSIFADATGAPADASGLYIDLHSYGGMVLWPWGYTSTAAPDGAALQTLGRKFAYFNGYDPFQASGLYPTDGTTDDFVYGDLGIASYCFEIGSSFFEPCSSFESTVLEDNMNALITAAKLARTPYQSAAGPEIVDIDLEPSAVVSPGASLTLNARADDTRFSTRGGAEPSQSIAAARSTLDLPPWDPAAPAASALSATDGSFDSSAEEVVGGVNLSGLTEGRHTLFLQGEDANASRGPVSAVFFWILDPATAPRFEGTVIAADSGLPLVATVRHQLIKAVTDARAGAYSMVVPEGSYALTAHADTPGYVPMTRTAAASAGGQRTVVNFILPIEQQIHVHDGESGADGWSGQSLWALSTEMAHSGSFAWSDSPGGNYANGSSSSLISPLFDFSQMVGLRLDFAHRFDFEEGYDYGRVEVSTDGGSSWQVIASFTGSDGGAWQLVSETLPQLDGVSTARIRFRVDSDYYLTADGWHVDDITISGGVNPGVPPVFNDGFETGDGARWDMAIQ